MSEMITADRLDFVEVANAIREKAGTSDALAFPAGFAEAIAAIESGGISQIGNFNNIAYGSIQPAEDVESIDITTEFELNTRPPYVSTIAVFRDMPSKIGGTNTTNSIICSIYMNNIGSEASSGGGSSYTAVQRYYNSSGSATTATKSNMGRNRNTITMYATTIGSAIRFTAGATYYWIVLQRTE